MDLRHTMAQIPGGGLSVHYGSARWDGTRWYVDDNGSLLDAQWLDPIQPVQGGQLAYLIVTDSHGQSSALVLGGLSQQPRPGTGTVQEILAAGAATRLVVLADDGQEYTTSRFIGSYALGDPVLIDWTAGVATIIGKIAEMTITPPPPPLPSGAAVTGGTVNLIASASDTFGVGGWGRWAGSTGGREKVYSGTQGGYTVTGSWFYGPWGLALEGKVIQQARFRVPARLPGVGASGPVTINLYAHTSQARPGGDVNRVAGPFAVTLPAGYSPAAHNLDPGLPNGWVVLPSSFHAALQQGGGVSISGGGYVGLNGRLDDGASGQTDIDWTNS